LRYRLQRISIYLGNNYPFYELRKVKTDQLIKDLDQLRSECENLLFKDHYHDDNYDEVQRMFKSYYPGQTFEEGKIISLSRGKGGSDRRARSSKS